MVKNGFVDISRVAIPFKWGQSFYEKWGHWPNGTMSQSLLNEVKVSTHYDNRMDRGNVAIPFKWGQSFYIYSGAGSITPSKSRNPF